MKKSDAKKEFDACRLALMDMLRRDKSYTTAVRIVGLEIISSGNSVTHTCWKAQATLAGETGIPMRTVKRAIGQLDGKYFTIQRVGRANHYRLNFHLLAPAELPLATNHFAAGIGAKTDNDRCQNEHGIGAKTAPLSLKGISFKSLQDSRDPERRGCGPAQGGRSKGDGPIAEKRSDGAAELKAAKLLGPDGFDVLSYLHEIDKGQPRLRLLRLVETDTATPADIEAARLAAAARRWRS